jgi:hypothetical protein
MGLNAKMATETTMHQLDKWGPEDMNERLPADWFLCVGC